MQFEIMVGLNEYTTKEELDTNLPQYVTKFISSEVDSDNVYKAKVELEIIDRLVDLGFYFDEDMVIYGSSLDTITTVNTLKELGLI